MNPDELIHIIDGTNDKKYFTIIPNYILNHSSMWDREVFIQMQRIAGENGLCWMSRQRLADQCGMSPRQLDRSIEYLLKHEWIERAGKKKVSTKGGIQEVNVYRTKDLWRKNIDYYESLKGVVYESTPLEKLKASTDMQKGGD
jgi:hypothetical protein